MVSAVVNFGREKLARVPREHHVRRRWLFGSAARGELSPTSDVDVLVEYRPGETPQGFDYFGIGPDLTPVFGREVDVIDADTVRRHVGERISRDLILIFEDGRAIMPTPPKDNGEPPGNITPEERDIDRLCHIFRSAEQLHALTPGIDQATFLASVEKRLAWVHLIQIMGEPASKLTEATPQRITGLPWPKVVGLRHRVVHNYDQIRYDVVYRIATTEMRPLIDGVGRFLKDNDVDCDERQQPWRP